MKKSFKKDKNSQQTVESLFLYLTSGLYQQIRRKISTIKNEFRRITQPNHDRSNNDQYELKEVLDNDKKQRKTLLDRRHAKNKNEYFKYNSNNTGIHVENQYMQMLLSKILVIVCFAIVVCIFLLFTSYLLVDINRSSTINKIEDYENSKYKKTGIHVVVGQFLGRGYPWNTEPNLSIDERNTNGYAPVAGAGQNGTPVHIPPSLRSRASQLFFVNRFNLIASDMISVNRSLPDARKLACRNIRYHSVETLPNTSVIIVFHNEAWSTLVRTVHSVVNRSPSHLLSEILLVDDASNRTFLDSSLDDYFEKFSNETKISIKILRSKERIGLINARILGARQAKGQVLTFLDAHVETTIGWLEPLLNRIRDNPKTVICPVIDIINDQTFAYAKSFDLHWGAMNWALNFRWFSVGQREIKALHKKRATTPFRTPIMAGGLFSIDRKYFFEMGEYDKQQKIWGGENIEMSLRIWQCGGRVEIAPCSHVAHLFRSSSPYSFGSSNDDKIANVLFQNLIRVVDVWLDEWKYFYYRLNPSAYQFLISPNTNKSEVFQDIQERHDLRRKLNCKSFEWYLHNVWPESFFPTKNKRFGQIKSSLTENCIQAPGTGRNPTGKLKMNECSIETYTPQTFVLPFPVSNEDSASSGQDYIRSDESVCFDSSDPRDGSSVSLIACSEFRRQLWILKLLNSFQIFQIFHVKSELCITLDKHLTFLILSTCDVTNRRQHWSIMDIPWNKTIL